MFVVRTVKHSFLSRAGTLTYVAFFLAQVRVLFHLSVKSWTQNGWRAVGCVGSVFVRPSS